MLNKKNLSNTVLGLTFLSGCIFFINPDLTAKELDAQFRDLTKEEETRHRKIGEDKLLVVNYNGITIKDFVNVENNRSSIVFTKAVMCGDSIYPTVLVRTIEKDIPEEFHTRNLLIIYNESLEEIAHHPEHLAVSNEFTDSPDKFKVGLQPKFTLETVEAFVCNSQVTLCEADEKVSMQCTFEDGRQANVCNGDGLPPNVLRIGKSLSQLDIDQRILSDYQFHKYSQINDLAGSGLSGVGNTHSFTENGMTYSFENHWSARSRDNYNFHTEFNVRKDGKIIESNRCIENNYK